MSTITPTFTADIQNILETNSDSMGNNISNTKKRILIFKCFSDWMHIVIDENEKTYTPDQVWGMVHLRALMMDEMEKRD